MSKPPLVSQQTMRPTRKTEQAVLAGGLTAAGVTPFIVFAFNRYYDGNVPEDVYEFMPYLSAFAVWAIQGLRSYFAKERIEPVSESPPPITEGT